MEKIQFDYSMAKSFIDKQEFSNLDAIVAVAHDLLHSKKGAGSEFLGWVDLPKTYEEKTLCEIEETAKIIQRNSDALIVVGIGGSYLGTRAAIEMLNHHFYNLLPKAKRKTPEIYFAGQNISGKYLKDLLEIIEEKDVSINVISKSGTTTEPAIAFRILKGALEKKYGKEETKKRIIATTDKSKGALRQLADEEGYKSFVIPDDIGGRYSVLTAVGLLPIAVTGIDIREIIKGATRACDDLEISDLEKNSCYQYAAARNILSRKGKSIEILVAYEPALEHFGEWWKQLFGESDGKNLGGIFPTTVNFSTDLHSMGQYIQQGLRIIFETVLHVEKMDESMKVVKNDKDLDRLNYLDGKSLKYVNDKAYEGTLLAHIEGEVPNLIINIPELTPCYFGYMVYFFEKACAIGGYMSGINPFDQPGVEEYKKNMFRLLEKPEHK
ncbi:MAG: glucose-6-phosphate isomerase [Alkaliphilus sp.]